MLCDFLINHFLKSGSLKVSFENVFTGLNHNPLVLFCPSHFEPLEVKWSTAWFRGRLFSSSTVGPAPSAGADS